MPLQEFCNAASFCAPADCGGAGRAEEKKKSRKHIKTRLASFSVLVGVPVVVLVNKKAWKEEGLGYICTRMIDFSVQVFLSLSLSLLLALVHFLH